MTQTLDVTILDDLGHPVLEGLEKFQLRLQMPVGGSLGEPSMATVTIKDSLSDLPKMEFLRDQYKVNEDENEVVAMVTRSGDLSTESYVRCYTRQASALVDEDYIERPNTNASFVIFKPNRREAECRVQIVNDRILEGEESFRLVLGTPDSPMTGGATLGGQVTTKIVITDIEDSPVIKFEKTQYTVNEPIIKGDITTLSIAVIREGDTSSLSEVRVSTKSGSATASRDFNPKSTLLRFTPGTEKLFVDIEINYDNKSENSESFSVHLSNDLQMIAKVYNYSRAIVYIEENSQLADVIFPVQPLIVSLRDYDRVEQSINIRPINGYPLICVSPCNPRHPKYKDVKRICRDEGIDDTQTKFRWRVGSPRDESGVYGYIRDLETNTVFTKARFITLDSIYFTRGSQVQCYARAVNSAGEPGMEVGSSIIIVDEHGMCPPRRPDAVGAEPFTAKVHYTGADDTNHPNKIKLSIQAPHTDGVLPIISTRRLSNFWLALSADAFRNEHPCSNLLDVHELATDEGFITNETKKALYIDDAEPYEFDNKLRPNSTLRFYKNLDLESCVWTFVAYFDMSELIRPCMGVVETDAEVLNIKQSYVSLKVPLFVSYVYYPTLQANVWRNFDQRTELRLRFVYNTAILWQEGISAHVKDDDVQARLYPVSMRVKEDGKLIVNFRTVANFRGQFLPNSPGGTLESTVLSLNDPNLEFKLRLIRSDPTYDQAEQLWEFTSFEARQDFSGDYKINLVPCYASLTQSYTLQPECSYGNPMTFDLPIRFQQVNDPVPAKFSLNTQFYLIRKRDLWLSESLQGLSLREEDTAFAPGDTIYGRINVDPVQSLGNQFLLTIDKVYLCSGKDGYIPRYDPDNDQYGCIGNTEHLESVFRIVDAEAPYTADTSYQGSTFNAMLARDDTSATNLVNQHGVDGFSFDSKPLFQVNSGKQWFLHAIYAIKSRNNNNVIQKRSVHNIVIRSLNDVSAIGNGEIGTNMAPLLLDFDGKAFNNETFKSDKVAESNLGHTPLLAVLISGGILLLTGIFVLVIFITHRRKRTSPPPTPSGTITVMSTQTGQTRVISNAHIFKPNDHTEV
ncbi:FRAS1-related extracellular matrix protein 2 [Mactra antiquata]